MGALADAVYGLAPVPPEFALDFQDAQRLAGSMGWPASYADLAATPERIVRLADAFRARAAREAALTSS